MCVENSQNRWMADELCQSLWRRQFIVWTWRSLRPCTKKIQTLASPPVSAIDIWQLINIWSGPLGLRKTVILSLAFLTTVTELGKIHRGSIEFKNFPKVTLSDAYLQISYSWYDTLDHFSIFYPASRNSTRIPKLYFPSFKRTTPQQPHMANKKCLW